MHIQELHLQTKHLNEQKKFYTDVLGLPLLTETAASFTVQAGTTRLSFQESQQETLYHIAFTIPTNKFKQAKDWISQRMPLLKNTAGEDEIHFTNLHAQSFYFSDAAGHILEYMVHYDLVNETSGDFGPEDVLRVSEIGLPVEDVLAVAAQLEKQQGIVSYPASSQASDGFAYLGDILGQLVVVKIGRPWLPTETIKAIASPVRVVVAGKTEQEMQFIPYPYTIEFKA
ncbi:hypothetical protein KDA_56080 [Dictyobacter alpinus]|uniref:VOC domain-containing protein n=1 Tax=Dictyobacter alpinus TaxID=2014873 RepID=A0A402BFG1_9CHLR|nr:hypothetical protein [Dictyobacter alpinus]GCE30124.1 hypothetical protein KDA_56080 [Dictyobacter alpinus]